jgi:hypothetical protein
LAVTLALAVTVLVPELQAARRHGNEAAAIGALKLLSTAQSLYREGDLRGGGRFTYAPSLGALVEHGLLDADLADGLAHGYRFELHTSPSTPEFLWCASANPVAFGETGSRSFWTNQAGVIHYDFEPPAVLRDDCAGYETLVAG